MKEITREIVAFNNALLDWHLLCRKRYQLASACIQAEQRRGYRDNLMSTLLHSHYLSEWHYVEI